MPPRLESMQQIQEDEYRSPYHHLVRFEPYSNERSLYGGLHYFGYTGKVIELVAQEPVRQLLNFGCGDGKFEFEIRKRLLSARIMGIDTSERAIAFARAFNFGNGIEFICGKLEDQKGTYDTIVTIEVLEHIPDSAMPGVTKALVERLEKGGRLIVSVPSANVPVNRKHYRHYTVGMLKRDFPELELEKLHYMISTSRIYELIWKIHAKWPSSRMLRKFTVSLAKRFFFESNEERGSHIVAVFRKKKEHDSHR